MALKKDGTVWTWGNNGVGQLGDGTSVTSAGYQEKWISENGRLKIGDDVWSYTLSDNKLTLTAKNGSVGIYERVQQ